MVLLGTHVGEAQAARLCRALHSDKAVSMVGVTPSATTIVSDASNVLDGDFKSAATVRAQGGSSGPAVATLTGRFANSRRDIAGVLLETPPNRSAIRITIQTYKDGRALDSATLPAADGSCPGICDTQDNQSFYGIKTSGAFDRIGVTVQIADSSQSARLLEFCAR